MKKLYTLLLLSFLFAGAYAQCFVKAFPVDTTVCFGEIVQLYDTGDVGACSWSPSNSLISPNTCNPLAIPFGTTTYTLTVTSGANTCTSTATLHVLPASPFPAMLFNPDTVVVTPDSAYKSYQWYYDTVPIPGATLNYFVIDTMSCQSLHRLGLLVIDTNDCNLTTGVSILCGGINESFENLKVHLSPNPAWDHLQITTDGFRIETMEVFNALGSRVYKSVVEDRRSVLNISQLPPGIYFLHLQSETERVVKRFVKE